MKMCGGNDLDSVMVMIQIVEMCGSKDLSNENINDSDNVVVMIQIMKICGGNNFVSANVWQ